MNRAIAFTVNGRAQTVNTEPKRPLLEALREDLGLTGTKFGCGVGHCAACTVLLDGKTVMSCQTALEEAEGKVIPSFAARRARIVVGLEGAAGDARAIMPDALLDAFGGKGK